MNILASSCLFLPALGFQAHVHVLQFLENPHSDPHAHTPITLTPNHLPNPTLLLDGSSHHQLHYQFFSSQLIATFTFYELLMTPLSSVPMEIQPSSGLLCQGCRKRWILQMPFWLFLYKQRHSGGTGLFLLLNVSILITNVCDNNIKKPARTETSSNFPISSNSDLQPLVGFCFLWILESVHSQYLISLKKSLFFTIL